MDPDQWLEIIAVVFGITNVYLLTRQNIWAWPAGIIMVSIYIYIFFNSKLYSDVILHIVYVILNIYGWWYWSRIKPGPEKKEIPVTTLPGRSIVTWIFVIMAGTIIWGYIMNRFTDASYAFFDAFTTVASLSAQFLLARKKIENWIIWIVVDVVAINIYLLKHLFFTSALYVIFLILCIIGWVEWRKTMVTPAMAGNKAK